MEYKWRAKWSKTGIYGDISHEDVVSFEAAIMRAQRAVNEGCKTATVLRADTEGVNADKYFLHHIVK